MNKKNGFIATSLIYSFFLVFIAIIVVLLNNFIANKTILERFNDDIRHTLDNERYSVTLYGTNSNIQDGVTLSNLVNDGSFINGTTYWDKVNLSTVGSTLYGGVSCFSSSSSGYIYQTIKVDEDNKYYFAVKYRNTSDATQNIYIDDTSYGFIVTEDNKSDWTLGSAIYTSDKDEIVNLVVGNGVGVAEFTDVIVINLTASFGQGNEPTKEWVDQNIKWFSGTLSYLKLDKIRSGRGIQVKFSPYKKNATHSVNCTPSIAHEMETTNYGADNITDSQERTYADFTINSIKENVTCTIDWSSD